MGGRNEFRKERGETHPLLANPFLSWNSSFSLYIALSSADSERASLLISFVFFFLFLFFPTWIVCLLALEMVPKAPQIWAKGLATWMRDTASKKEWMCKGKQHWNISWIAIERHVQVITFYSCFWYNFGPFDSAKQSIQFWGSDLGRLRYEERQAWVSTRNRGDTVIEEYCSRKKSIWVDRNCEDTWEYGSLWWNGKRGCKARRATRVGLEVESGRWGYKGVFLDLSKPRDDLFDKPFRAYKSWVSFDGKSAKRGQ